MTILLDANVLISLARSEHSTHQAAQRWWSGRDDASFATCPITEGSLTRFLFRTGLRSADVVRVLAAISSVDGHKFWADDLPYTSVDLASVRGHRQVTDAYLAALARKRRATLATFDQALAAQHPDVAQLIAP